jgi:hypothetical protein
MLFLCLTVLPLAVLFSSEQVAFQALALVVASVIVTCLIGHSTDSDT